MAINFNSLPSDKPYGLPEAGTYKALIEKAEMKSPKDPAKKPYLNLQLQLFNQKGEKCGKVFDILTESEHSLVQYKLRRFVTALELPITGDFELKDLTKIVAGKEMLVDITIDEKGDRPRAVVDVLKDMVYYRVADAQSIFGQVYAGEQTSDEVINAEDAIDSTAAPEVSDDEY